MGGRRGGRREARERSKYKRRDYAREGELMKERIRKGSRGKVSRREGKWSRSAGPLARSRTEQQFNRGRKSCRKERDGT